MELAPCTNTPSPALLDTTTFRSMTAFGLLPVRNTPVLLFEMTLSPTVNLIDSSVPPKNNPGLTLFSTTTWSRAPLALPDPSTNIPSPVPVIWLWETNSALVALGENLSPELVKFWITQ